MRGSGVRIPLAAPSVPHYRAPCREGFRPDQFGKTALNFNLETLPSREGMHGDTFDQGPKRLDEAPACVALRRCMGVFGELPGQALNLTQVISNQARME